MITLMMSEYPEPPKLSLGEEAEAEVLARLAELGIPTVENLNTEIALYLSRLEIKAKFIFTPPDDIRERWAKVSHDHPELRWMAYDNPKAKGNTVVGELEITRET